MSSLSRRAFLGGSLAALSPRFDLHPLLDGLAHDNGVLYLGDGSWGKLRALNKPEKLPHLAVANKEYHLSLHRLEGAHRFHLALAESECIMDVCQSGQRKAGLVSVGG